MSVDTTPQPVSEPAEAVPRAGSRKARMAHPLVLQAIRNIAADHGVCTRPQLMRWTNLATGETHLWLGSSFLIWNQRHLLNALRELETFYNEPRPHHGIANI